MSEPLIDDATFAELRELETSAMGQRAAIVRESVTVGASVPITIIPAIISAQGFSVHAAIAGLGGGRASHIAFVPWGTDVLDGDVITSDERTYAVCGAGYLDTSVGLALSERGRG
jgi:hypothetical protein